MLDKHSTTDILHKYRDVLGTLEPMRPMGKVVQVNGMSILTEGPPEVSIGDICRVTNGDSTFLECEVVGFQNHKLILMPLGPVTGVAPRSDVLAQGSRLSIGVSEQLLGRVIDGLGRPLDQRSPVISSVRKFADQNPPSPTLRTPIREPLLTGVRAIDGLLTVGRGQRIGIFAGTGVGKSTLLGMIARYTKADVNVICLVGERGREVLEFIQNDLGEDGLKKSVIVVATSDKSALEKVYAAGFATSIAEYFRDTGKHVNLLMDSVTRYCMSLREIGIAAGEQLGPGGYPPGVWFKLSRLAERSGALKEGSITGFYTVLVEADDMNDPVADNTRGILDGHIVLSRRLAARGHYPSIEVTDSISRVMDRVITPDHKELASRVRRMLAAYRENEELITLGAYAKGSSPDVDWALLKMDKISSFLRQPIEEGSAFEITIDALSKIGTFQDEEEEDLYE